MSQLPPSQAELLDSNSKALATHLTRHGITEVARARMIDWIYEVLMAYKMSEQTFFFAVQYLDRYLASVQRTLQLD